MNFFGYQEQARKNTAILVALFVLSIILISIAAYFAIVLGIIAGQYNAIKALAGAEGLLGGAMLNFNALTEAYPDLKADQTMMQLSEELTSTENKVSFARQSYNDEVMVYNTQRETFPDALFVGMMNFKPAELFVVKNPEVKERVEVKF